MVKLYIRSKRDEGISLLAIGSKCPGKKSSYF
jgi:hypothetical protein